MSFTSGRQLSLSAMWKFTQGVPAQLRCVRAIGRRRHLIIARRKYSTQPPTSSKTAIGKWILGISVTGLSGVVGYAWYDPANRKSIENAVPYSKEVLDPVLNALPSKLPLPTLPPHLQQYLPWAKKEEEPPRAPAIPPAPPALAVKKAVKVPDPEDIKQKEAEKAEQAERKKLVAALKAEEEKRVKEEQRLLKEKEKEELALKKEQDERAKETARQKAEVERQLKERQALKAAENEALELIVKSLLRSTEDASDKAKEAMGKRIEAVKQHATLLKTAMEDTSSILQKDGQWQAVASAYEIRQAVMNDSEKKVMNTRLQLEKLRKTLDEGFNNPHTKHNTTLMTGQDLFNRISHSLNLYSTEVSKAENEVKMVEKYKHLVDQGRDQFRRELESIVPNVKIGEKNAKKMTEDELNSLIAHAHVRIDQLQKQLAKQIALEQERLQDAVRELRDEDAKFAREKTEEEIRHMKNQFAIEKETMMKEARVDFEEDLRAHLARQAAAHSDHLKDVLDVQKNELESEFDKTLNLKLLEERACFQTEMSGWIGRLKGIEAAVEARAETEKLAKQAQELWLACVALNGVVRQGRKNPLSIEDKLKPLKKEIRTVTDAGQNHPFVNTLLESIPEVAIERGVWTEDALKERFIKVKKVCKSVAMVQSPSESLFKYVLSYLQSFIIFESAYIKGEEEIDMKDLNTFSILANADQLLEKGELEKAIRLMNQLHGQSRFVASDWLQEAKLFLETRQAAEALIAFSAARGLGKLF